MIEELIGKVARGIAGTLTADPWERIDDRDQEQFTIYAKAAVKVVGLAIAEDKSTIDLLNQITANQSGS